MKRHFESLSFWLVVTCIAFAHLLTSAPVLAQGFPGAVFLKTPRGPSGDPIADVNQQVVSTITIINVDSSQDSFLITNLFDVVHHFTGDEISPNLLETVLHTNRVVLHSANSGFPDYFLTVTYTNTVLTGDTNLPGHLLTDDAFVGLIDSNNISGGIPLGFFLTVPGQITIPSPTNTI